MTHPLIAQLFEGGQELSEELKLQLLQAEPSLVPELVALLDDESLSEMEAPGEGWVPEKAFLVLNELRPIEMLDPVLKIIAKYERDTYLYNTIAVESIGWGDVVIEPILRYLEKHKDNPEEVSSLLCFFSDQDAKDERIFQRMIEHTKLDEGLMCQALGAYGDPRAIPHLIEMFRRFEFDKSDPMGFHNHTFIEILAAIEELDGELPPALLKKERRLRQMREDYQQEILSSDSWEGGEDEGEIPNRQPLKSQKVGRNQPCPCGSGKKYKRCHGG
jgi:hypothetical protein